ncbi:MAG: LCP family protein [Patescibacteria group bacterium]
MTFFNSLPKLTKQQLFLFFILPCALIISIAVTIVLAGPKRYSLTALGELNTQNLPQAEAQVVALDNSKPPEDLKNLSVLLLGYGGAGHQGGYLTDVIQLVYVDFQSAKIYLISIPRDLWVKLPNGKSAKVNSAFTLGDESGSEFVQSGGRTAKEMVSIITGLPINNFVAVDFVGFQRLIGEQLGGIDVNVAETLEDEWYPVKGLELETCGMTAEEVAEVSNKFSGFELEKQFPCRYEHLLFKQGLNHMEGGDALKYVRSRHGSGAGDFSRSRRQQEVMAAMAKKLLSKNALTQPKKIFENLSHTISTDFDISILEYLAPAFASIQSNYQQVNVNLSTENVLQSSKSANGQYIIIPKAGENNWQEVHNYIKKQIET